MINLTNLILCIAMVEGANPTQKVGECWGKFQIKPIFIEEVNRILRKRYGISPNGGFVRNDCLNPSESEWMVRYWLEDRVDKHPEWTVYDLALAYNAGDTGAKTATKEQKDYAVWVRNLYNLKEDDE